MMKKTRAVDRPTSGASVSSRVDKHLHDTNGNSAISRKHSPTDKPLSSTKPLTKSLSKSHDNLASTLRRKAVQVSMATTSKEVLRTASPGPKFKTPKNPSTPIRKSHSNPLIDLSDEPMKRAQSAQNISQDAPVAHYSVKTGKVKRASSTQNVSHKNTGRHVKSAGPSTAMAYNAELLASFEKEKKSLERRISELIQVAEGRKTEIEKYKFQVKNLKQRIPSKDVHQQLGDLTGENEALKGKLQELGVAVEGYTETQVGGVGDMGGAEGGSYGLQTGSVGDAIDLAATPDSVLGYSMGEGDVFVVPDGPASVVSMDCNWDKQSNKSSDALSEISVACLQDRISQMEETHYSTNEELQATLQELGDLQQAVNDLTYENERLADEKCVLLESLCAQTEKLENARMQVEHLKVWLVADSENHDRSDNERQLVCLVKSTQEQKEELQLKQMELCNAYHSLETDNRELQDVITALRDKARILEMKNESLSADKRTMETQLSELRELTAKDQIELQRYRTALDNEKQKVSQLEQERNATDKSDIEDLLACCRAEKEKGEEKLTDLEEQLAVSQNENKRQQDVMASMEEELKVCKNNAKTKVSAMEYEVSRVEEARSDLQLEMNSLRDHIDQLQLDCDRYLDDKRAHDTTVMSLEHELAAARLRCSDYEVQYNEAKSVFDEKQEEWAQFQADLQTAVVIANEFKSEAQESMEKVLLDKFTLREENDNLRAEIDRLKEDAERCRGETSSDVSLMRRSDIRGRVMSTMDRGLSALRQGRKLSDTWGGNSSMSVKHLIHSIEEQVKTERSTPPRPNSPVLSDASGNSRRNSMDSPGITVESPPIIRPDRRTTPTISEIPKSVLRRSDGKENWPSSSYRPTLSEMILDGAATSEELLPGNRDGGRQRDADISPPKKALTGILTNKTALKKHSKSSEAESKSDLGYSLVHGVKSDPLSNLAKQMGGSKRNALLKWCQMKTQSYSAIDITNFSSSWNDGLAMCAILHSYLPDKIPYKELTDQDKMRNFTLAFKAAESVGIVSILNVHDMVSMERPDWQAVMAYITSIYKHFEVDKTTS